MTKYSFTKPISFFFCCDNKILQYSKLIKRNFENVLHINFNVIKILLSIDTWFLIKSISTNLVQFLIKIEKKKKKKQKSRSEKCVMYTYPEPPWFCFVIILWIFKFSFFFFFCCSLLIVGVECPRVFAIFNKIRTPSVSLQSLLASRKVLKFLIHLSWFLSNTLRESLLPKEALDRLK